MVAELREMVGTRVTAKALGWNEELMPEQRLDLDPFDGPTDLSGELAVVEVNEEPVGPLTVWLVDGREADPKTVESNES